VPAASPGYRPFTVCTESGRYCAEMDRFAQSRHPWRAYYKLTIWEEHEDQRRELWSQDYWYDGYAGGLLSPDGRIFVHVARWYSPDTVVWIYSSEGSLEVPGRDFPFHHTRHQKGAVQEEWLAAGSSPYKFVGTEGLSIHTIDDRTHYVRLSDGVLKQDVPFGSAPGGSKAPEPQ
jgi:hypothetical protein